MNKIFTTSLLVLTSLFSSATAQWVRQTGPQGATVNAIVSDGSILYAGSGAQNSFGDLFVSSDDGSNWTSIGANIPRHGAVLSVGIRSGVVFVGTTAGMYGTNDHGKSWHQTGNSLPTSSVTVLLTSDSDIIAGIRGQGLFRTVNGGQQWSPIGGAPLFTQVNSLIRTGGTLIAGTNAKGVFRSTDNGLNWTAIDTGIATGNDYFIFAVHSFSGSLFAGTLRGIYRSDDGGDHWVSARAGLPIDESGNAFVSRDSTIYVLANSYRVYKSSDKGTHWTPITDSAGLGVASFALTLHKDNLYLGSQIDGVFRNAGTGGQWQPLTTGMTAVSVPLAVSTAFRFDGKAILLSGTNDADYGYGWHSEDAGAHWTMYSSGTKRGVTDMTIVNDAIEAATSGDGIQRSTDFGVTWETIPVPPSSTYLTSLCNTPRVQFAGVASTVGIITSTTNGVTWEAPTGTIIPSFVSKIFSDNGIIYAVGNLKVFRSKDEGNSWDTLSGNPINSMQWTGFARTSSRLLIGSSSGLFESKDDASTWDAVNGPLAISKIYGLASDRDFVVAGVESGILLSTDGGASWTSSPDSLPGGIALQTVSMDAKYIYAGTKGYGLWRLARPQAAEVSRPATSRLNIIPGGTLDGQPTLEIESSNVGELTLTVTDILGRELFKKRMESNSASLRTRIQLPGLTHGVTYFATVWSSVSESQSVKFRIP